MLRILLFVGFLDMTMANHGTPWHIKLGYQNIDGGVSQSNEKLEGLIFSYENLINRQIHSYFSTFTEISYSSADNLMNEEMTLFHYGLGIKWNFGPTDYDYEPAVDYEYVLNQGSLYLKMGFGYTSYKLENSDENLSITSVKNNEFSSQYGIGYELLGKRTGFYLEYMNSDSNIYNTGLIRAGLNWKF